MSHQITIVIRSCNRHMTGCSVCNGIFYFIIQFNRDRLSETGISDLFDDTDLEEIQDTVCKQDVEEEIMVYITKPWLL